MRIRIDRDQWEEIFDSLSRNRTRTFLTAFGIFWGVFMLILLMGGGRGLQSMLGQNFAGFASNAGFLFSGQTSKPYKGFPTGRSWNIHYDDLQRVQNNIPEVEMATPVIFRHGQTAVVDQYTSRVHLFGILPGYSQVENLKIRCGRALNDVDVMEMRKVCVLGSRAAEELFPTLGKNGNPCGRFIRVEGVYYRVVGVSGKSDGGVNIGGNATQRVYLPFTTMRNTYNRGSNIDMLCLLSRDQYRMSDVQKRVEMLLKRVHTIHPNDTQAVFKVNTEALFGMVDSLFNGVSILVWMIGLGTLLAGAIGVSNIMVVTVKERTTEIGIRRAIGATPQDILAMVMSESVVLTLVAGMSGIVLAVLILQGMESAFQPSSPEAQFQVSFGVAMGAASLLAFLGVLSGLAPALRAMKIKPVDALCDE